MPRSPVRLCCDGERRDARLAGALRAGGGDIRGIEVLERMPPVLVVTWANGESDRYPARAAAR